MARLKELKTENTRLKKVYAVARLKAEILKEAIERSGEAFAPTGALTSPRHLATMLQKRVNFLRFEFKPLRWKRLLNKIEISANLLTKLKMM